MSFDEEEQRDELDDTLIVRRAEPGQRPNPGQEFDDTIATSRPDDTPEVDATRVVRRDEDGEVEATRVVRRPEAEQSAPADAGGADGAGGADDTVIVRRAPASSPGAPPEPAAPVAPSRSPTPRSLRARRTPIVLPTSVSSFARVAEAVGVNAVDTYQPRPLPAPPAPGPDLGSGLDATRAEAPSMRSVRRASRKAGRLAVAALGGACAVSIAGLIGIAVVIFGG